MASDVKCAYCSSQIESKWNYCPGCGHKIDRYNMFVNIINKHLELIRKKFSTPSYNKGIKDEHSGIMISITTGFGAPQISEIPIKLDEMQHYKINQKKTTERPQLKEIIEPEINIEKTKDNVIISANLPGVKSENDVEIAAMPNSIELRAYAGDRGYFRILKIPREYDLVEKQFKDEKLKLKFSF